MCQMTTSVRLRLYEEKPMFLHSTMYRSNMCHKKASHIHLLNTMVYNKVLIVWKHIIFKASTFHIRYLTFLTAVSNSMLSFLYNSSIWRIMFFNVSKNLKYFRRYKHYYTTWVLTNLLYSYV